MKNYYKSIKANLIIILLLGVFSTNAAVFHSTTAGGNWNNTATWQEAAVPTTTDDVIITGPGIVYINTNAECNNLTINSGAILKNPDWTTVSLTVNGDIINNGQLIMPVGGGGKLSLYNCDLVETDLITNSGILEMDLNSLILSNSVIHNATLQGLVIIGADPVTFEGETVNNGTLRNNNDVDIYWCCF